MKQRPNFMKIEAQHYFNREASWLQFNERVLDEAKNPKTPILERLKFLAIFQSNLDEFNMVRVASLKTQVRLGVESVDSRTQMTSEDQLEMIYKKTERLFKDAAKMYRLLFEHPDLRQYNSGIFDFTSLRASEKQQMSDYFQETVLPLVGVTFIDRNTKLPSLKNKRMYIGAMLADEAFVIIKVPEQLPRLIALNEEKTRFILLENLIQAHMPHIVDADLLTYSAFRILRNYDLDLIYDEADDIIETIQEQLEKRKKGFVVGLQIEYDAENRNQYIIQRLKQKLGIQDADVYEFVDTPIDLSFLFAYYSSVKAQHPEFAYEPLLPQHPQMIDAEESLLNQILLKDRFVYHPFESFEASVVRFLEEAALDPYVTEIKQTIYRLSSDSKIAEILKTARKKGKKVSVMVELKARFDEQNNIEIAKEFEELGIEVIYSEARFKAHSKIILAIREINGEKQYFTHIGTGNYNESTATLYTDCGVFSANPRIGRDAEVFFYALKEHVRNIPLDTLLASPNNIAEQLLDRIDQEIVYHQMYGDGYIIFKVNSLTYQPIIERLYAASQAGVKVDLIIRGICCLRPQLPVISENIRVISIVGRYLEHSRIYYFHHHQDEQVFVSSADLMGRNLDRRYELATPVQDREIKQRILSSLQIMLVDNVKARELDASGQYHLRSLKPGDALIDSQVILFEQAMVTTPPTREIIQQEVELQTEEQDGKRRSWKFWKKS
ncbi:MAG: polyphosphate kinase 1 [Culicoidibacterales bacterium]